VFAVLFLGCFLSCLQPQSSYAKMLPPSMAGWMKIYSYSKLACVKAEQCTPNQYPIKCPSLILTRYGSFSWNIFWLWWWWCHHYFWITTFTEDNWILMLTLVVLVQICKYWILLMRYVRWHHFWIPMNR
jgi:hypothetical protein